MHGNTAQLRRSYKGGCSALGLKRLPGLLQAIYLGCAPRCAVLVGLRLELTHASDLARVLHHCRLLFLRDLEVRLHFRDGLVEPSGFCCLVSHVFLIHCLG